MSLEKFPIQTISISNDLYPALLKKIPDAPGILYYRGNLPLEENCFAIVGTRRASDYGKEIAFSFSRALTEAGLTIVSGMAIGIDTFSHEGAVEATDPRGRSIVRPQGSVGCPTIAVLGTGLDEQSIYPRENLKLARQILEQGGCLLSEYLEGTNGSQFTFPQRNRIIAGLSLGVLVVEAKIKSGALITASFAKKYQRKIFAIPGSIYNQNFKGCHLLIKQGAKLVESANDILKELGFEIKKGRQSATANETENLILTTLEQGGRHIDKIIEITKLPPAKISAVLSIMEMEDKIKNIGGNVYALIR